MLQINCSKEKTAFAYFESEEEYKNIVEKGMIVFSFLFLFWM
jgi:hypothetical protein